MLNNDVNSKTLSRIELLKLAQTLRVTDADVMTRAELRAAIERARAPEARQQAYPVSWLGKARRVLASVVERGLHLPEAATLIRGGLPVRPFQSGPPPVATVTLARIYAAQGHLVRAIGILDEVLVSDPDHELARGLQQELQKLLDERKELERRQQSASAPPAANLAQPSATEPFGASPEVAPEEAPPSEAQLAASELLGAVSDLDLPDLDVSSTDEITLAGTGPEIRGVEPPESEETAPPAHSQPHSTPLELIEAEAETRRGSDAPAAVTASSGPRLAPAETAAAEPLVAEPLVAEPLVAERAPEASGSEPAAGTRTEDSSPVAAPEQVAAADVAVPETSAGEAPAADPPAAEAPAVQVPAAVEQPRPAGLVLIETSEPSAYLYWELAIPALANGGATNGGEPHWVCVVTHTPRGARSERREYRFPVQRAAGAVRIEGLPRYAVVRAKLTRGEAPEAPALVVAGSVRVACTAGGCDGSALEHAQPGFVPHPAADPTRLAQRAAAHLASAAPLYC